MLVSLDHFETEALMEPGGANVWRHNINLTAKNWNLFSPHFLLEVSVEFRTNLHVLIVVRDYDSIHVNEFFVALFSVELVVL